MSQTVAAIAVLGPGKTGLTIGYRVLNLDGTQYSAFTTTGVSETSVPGTYRVANGVIVPDAGGHIVFGVSGTDYAEATVSQAPAKAGDAMTLTSAYGDLITFLYDVAGGKWVIDSVNKQLTLYKSDNATLVATFNLKDSAGVLSVTNVFTRERV